MYRDFRQLVQECINGTSMSFWDVGAAIGLYQGPWERVFHKKNQLTEEQRDALVGILGVPREQIDAALRRWKMPLSMAAHKYVVDGRPVHPVYFPVSYADDESM